MSEYKIPVHGTICWRELATNDPAKSAEFYKEMFDWGVKEAPVGVDNYNEIHHNDAAIGGILKMDEKWGDNPPPPYWSAYIAVDNIEEIIAKIKENGGTMCCEPFDVQNVGRMAVASDPAGATFSILQFAQQA